MLSDLLIPLYAGIIPIVLVSGMAIAIAKRRTIGSRAAIRLIAGGGLLLMAHVPGLLWPHSANALHDLPGHFRDSWQLRTGMRLLPITANAVGLGLIITAVFTARPPAEDNQPAAGADQHPPPVRRHLSAVTTVVAIVAASALVLAAAWYMFAPARVDDQYTTWRDDEGAQAAACLQTHAEIAQITGEPAERMLLREAGGWLRVYVSEPDNWILACQGGPQALMAAFGTVMNESTDDPRFFGGYTSVAKAHMLMGPLPDKTAYIEATLPDGQVLHGYHDGSFFVVWAPGVEVEDAQIAFYTQDRDLISTANAPTEHP